MNNRDIEPLVRANIRSLCPYSTARDEYQGSIGIFLDANESPYDTGYNRYPDPHQKAVKARLSEIKGLPAENIFLGNGSDEAIDLVFRVFCTPGVDNAVIMSPSYGMYGVAAATNDIEVREVALDEEFSLSTEALFSACDSNTKVIFLCSPNNPSGNALPMEQIEKIVTSFNGIVVVDEAYADFSLLGSLRSKVNEWPNLIVLQTLSKAWGLAGLRLGIAFAQEYTIRLMSMVKYPYNISQATQNAVLKALAQPVEEKIAETIEQRGAVAEKLASMSCVKKIYPSDANFLLVKFDNADEVYGHLLADGIIVRNRNKVRGCSGCLRITIGLAKENKKLIESLKEYEKGNIRR